LNGGAIMGLFGLLKNGKRSAYHSEDLNHLNSDGELPWGWHTANKAFTQKIESEYKLFFNAWLDSTKQSDLKQYAALKSLVLFMNDVKALCQKKGECFVYWRDTLFDDKYLLQQTKLLHQLEGKIKKQ
jgi:hypothetical protein